MSEGARPGEPCASLTLRLSDQRRPTLAVEAGPERADEGGGARRRGGSDEPTFCKPGHYPRSETPAVR